jgi:dipeptide/tripeptide permease
VTPLQHSTRIKRSYHSRIFEPPCLVSSNIPVAPFLQDIPNNKLYRSVKAGSHSNVTTLLSIVLWLLSLLNGPQCYKLFYRRMLLKLMLILRKTWHKPTTKKKKKKKKKRLCLCLVFSCLIYWTSCKTCTNSHSRFHKNCWSQNISKKKKKKKMCLCLVFSSIIPIIDWYLYKIFNRPHIMWLVVKDSSTDRTIIQTSFSLEYLVL